MANEENLVKLTFKQSDPVETKTIQYDESVFEAWIELDSSISDESERLAVNDVAVVFMEDSDTKQVYVIIKNGDNKIDTNIVLTSECPLLYVCISKNGIKFASNGSLDYYYSVNGNGSFKFKGSSTCDVNFYLTSDEISKYGTDFLKDDGDKTNKDTVVFSGQDSGDPEVGIVNTPEGALTKNHCSKNTPDQSNTDNNIIIVPANADWHTSIP